MRTAIVGTGGIARSHADAACQLAERVELVAAVDVDADRLAAFRERYGIRAGYTDLQQMLERERPDLVQICTPPGLHVEHALAALEAGAWVLCEKPLCGSLADVDTLEAAQRRSGAYVSSVFQWRYGSGAGHVRDLIRTRAFGPLYVGVCNTLWYRDPAYHAVGWRGNWATEMGGVNMGHAIHLLDLLLYLLGEWRSVHGVMATLDRSIDVENVFMGSAQFASGALVSIANSLLSPRQESYLRLDFARASIELTTLYGYRNDNWRFSAAPELDPAEFERLSRLPEDVPSTHATQLAALLDGMQRGQPPRRTALAEVRRTLEFLLSLYKAAVTGRPVERGEIGPDDPFYRGMTYALSKEHP